MSTTPAAQISTEIIERLRTIAADVQYFLPFEDCRRVSRSLVADIKTILRSTARGVHMVEGEYDNSPHAWVEIPSLRLYIDPTYEQFDPNFPGMGWKRVRIGTIGDLDYEHYVAG